MPISRANARSMLVDNQVRLETVKQLRDNPGSVRSIDGARCALSFPPLEYELLKLKYPVLVHGSTHEKKMFMERFIQSAESKPYRVS